jgi:sRNA-binding carbon storage regulator CsrA
MLVLSRKPGEALLLTVPGIEKPIRVSFVPDAGKLPIRFGIEADSKVVITREEIAHLYNRKTGKKL